ncbi:MCE family protein [Acidiferrimicrobium sp. IK]|uniref:MCE family protein n=1 Tax=Acidiferrimicrobium sp. IK TaxID=2871700 RepID=UPI0021CB2D11|nr:MCE family protein [Acidiferrimicrobium sp. IK]MCU4187494.1 MCE family protein [Acidiferrimicrobium sp. IK]
MSTIAARRRALAAVTGKLAVFVVAAIAATAVLYATLVNADTAATRGYRAEFSDASYLQPGDPVRIAGVEVGRVTAVGVRAGHAAVGFKLDEPHQVTSTTSAAIHYENLLGNRYLALSGGAGGRVLPPGSTIPIGRTQPALDLSALFQGFQPLFQALTPSQINSLAGNVIATFQGEAPNVDALVTQTAALTSNLADRGQIIDAVVRNLTDLSTYVAGHDAQVGQLIDQFSSLASTLGADSPLLDGALASAAKVTTSLDGLVAGIQPAFEHSVTGLVSATATLQADQGSLDAALNSVPSLAGALTKTVDNGSYLNVYLCETTLNVAPGLNLSPIVLPVSLAPLLDLSVPSGLVGNGRYHTANCS